MVRPVLRDWVMDLPMMQQTVLLTAVRGPDGIRKDHVAKLLCRWLRRCVLYSAMDQREILNPYEQGGGSFTGQSIERATPVLYAFWQNHWQEEMNVIVGQYLRSTDELPHHFQMHLMHAAEIVGYKYPESGVRTWWNYTYRRMVGDLHLHEETESEMDSRLGDSFEGWKARESVKA